MANPPGEPGQAGKTDMPEFVADPSADDLQADGFRGRVGSAEEQLFHFREIVADQEKLLDLDQQMVDGVVAALNDRTPAELPGVDTSAIRQVSPQMQRELQNAISGDVASHRHHLLPFLTVKDAVIAGAQVIGGQEQIDVLFSISAVEEDLDDRTGQVLAGDTCEHSWEERWRFAREPQADTSASDERHEITFDRTGQWMVAHRGWIVTQIERLPAS